MALAVLVGSVAPIATLAATNPASASPTRATPAPPTTATSSASAGPAIVGVDPYAVAATRQPLTTNARSPVVHDNEVMALANHDGRLFAATDQWEYAGPDAHGQVLVKTSAGAPWKVFEETQSTRVQAIDSFAIPADQGLGAGHSLLVTQAIVDGHSEIQWLLDGATSFTAADAYVLPAPADAVRSFGAHEAAGVWSVYAGVDPTGILRGTWSKARHTFVFSPTPELSAAAPTARGLKTQKVTGFADCGGALYVTVNTKLYRRNDGALPPGTARWALVYQEPPVGAYNSGLRGVSCITHDRSPSLLVSTEGTGDVYRLDTVGGQVVSTLEYSPATALTAMLRAQGVTVPASGPGAIDYVIAAYNNFETVTIGGVPRQLFGLEWGYDGHCPAGRTCAPSGFDASACFAVRTDPPSSAAPPSYAMRCLNGPQFRPSTSQTSPVRSGQAFVSIRTIQPSPFSRRQLFYGGYDNDFSPADGAAWVATSTTDALHLGGPPPTLTSSISGPSTGALSPWVKDTVHALDIFLPDGNSDYYLGGFGTVDGARTVVTGRVPTARYWSFTAYTLVHGTEGVEIHDTQIDTVHGRYRLTIAAGCRGAEGSCLATRGVGAAGVVVLRLYVPVDLDSKGTGGVPLPSLSYRDAQGKPISLDEAAGTTAVGDALAGYRQQHGALPPELTQAYPPDPPVPTPVVDPPPPVRVAHHQGKFNNPDSTYVHVRYTTTRGNLVVSARAPTYQTDTFHPVNNLARPASQSPQVRYWSLCIVLQGLHTGDCLRDEEVHLDPGTRKFTAIVAPTCPMAGYRNCLTAGPQPLQVSLAYRYVLPSRSFKPLAFRGPYAMTARYVARPG